MKVLICGGRDITIDQGGKIWHLVKLLPSDTTVIVGGAKGADSIAEDAARAKGLKVQVFPADWDTHGKRAGPIRNQQMLEQEPDLVLAFHDGVIGLGTGDMIRRAQKAKIPVLIYKV